MVYSLTEKLSFKENPVIEVKGKKLKVKADAITVMSLLDVLETKGELAASRESFKLLFDEKDQKTIKALNLQWSDYSTLLSVAVDLALGTDPDADAPGEA